MSDNDNRLRQMFVRVREFFARHTADFSLTSVAHQLFTELAGLITELDGHAANQAASATHAEHRTELRGNARRALREELEALYRAARAMGLETDFQLPERGNDNALLHSARGSAAKAVPLSAQFIAHEMSADFLADLNAAADALEAAIAEQGNAVAGRVTAGAEIDERMDRGVEIVRILKDIVRIKYANNPVVLAEWTSASHVEKAPRRSASQPSPAPPAPGSTPPHP